ncbi:glutamic acid-rich protein isoform X2 [Oreochromis niloticus]|uniref:glutamic acid-rich protein isoform X2 n=1 Tax=Oreochromis niloticus TaxID=8128 RepID=UPI000905A59C|nr:glutamic acid-rich protein isoform X2 [Oreochromis niloticus]
MERYDNFDLDLECDGGAVSQKTPLFGGIFKKSSKSTEPSAQDNLSVNGELSKSNDSLSDNTKKKGFFKGMLKKTTKSAKEDQPQATLSLQTPELSASNDSLDSKSKDKSGVLGGLWKISHKLRHVQRPSQDLLDISESNDSLSEDANAKEDLSAPSKISGSNDNLSVNGNTKETSGMFSGMFKKSPKPYGARGQSQEDLSAPNDLSGSNDNLSENHAKEKGGIFTGMFRKKGAKSQSQDDLSVDDEPLAGNDSAVEKSSKGGVAKILRNPFTSSSQDKEKTDPSGDSQETVSTTEKPKTKQEKSSNGDDEETSDHGDNESTHKQNKLAGAMTKLNPFRFANKNEKEAGLDEEDPTVSNEKSSDQKQEKETFSHDKVKPRRTEDNNEGKDMTSREKKEKPAKPPAVPARPSEEELNRIIRHSRQKLKNQQSPSGEEGIKEDESAVAKDGDDEKNSPEGKTAKVEKHKRHNPFMAHLRSADKDGSDDEALKVDDESAPKDETNEEEGKEKTETKDKKTKRNNPFMHWAKAASDDEGLKEDEEENNEVEDMERTENKVKKPKKHNPFMSRIKAASDDEGLNEDEESASEEEKNEDVNKEKTEIKVKIKKKHNPFMPGVKAKVVQRRAQEAAKAENEGENRSVFDQLEDYRIGPASAEDSNDVDLMEWWENVEQWKDTPQHEDMTEKEEAKAFALTADKLQKGIRVFNKLFTERAESLWQHVIDLNAIADGLDKFSKNTKIAQITGGSTSAIGGVTTVTGLALAPVTMGTSLIVTAVGLGIAAAGGLTSAGAGISNQVNNTMDRKKVEKIVQDYQEKMEDLNKCLTFIKQGIENLRRFDLIKMKNSAYNQDFPALTSRFYEDGAMAGKAILINANEIMRFVQIAHVAGSTAARAVQIASMATGVLTGLFVVMDIYFVSKDSKELKKGAKSEFAAKIREVAQQLHDGLVELNSIHQELQFNSPEKDSEKATEDLDSEKKDDDSSDEDEIDRIKKAIKKELENREYV